MKSTQSAKLLRQTKKTKRREETREKLLTAANQLFSQYGYKEVSVTEISQAVGVTHSMINVHFGGKPGLLCEIVKKKNESKYKRSLEIYKSNFSALERLYSMLFYWLQADTENPEFLSIIQSYSWVWPEKMEKEDTANRDRFKALLTEIIREGQTLDNIPKSIVPEIGADAIFAIYTLGLRCPVFEGLNTIESHERTMREAFMVLGISAPQ
ncbi:TetR/AcrR family transcriptional regulator [Marimonas lutisalis]|uniref:TetR/AcrR family transcriptional regulator n=1 Tax=Marimonas lutisalis TaxID=2545756 RepID=UPI0010F70C66|nr:TetR/AcrR family transcriptional regulator [Marimonas lutisalis]